MRRKSISEVQGEMQSFPYDAEYTAIIETVRLLLRENTEWVERYTAYAEIIAQNLAFIRSSRTRLRQWAPLRFYINVSNAKLARRSLKLDVRYLGQNVASLTLTTNAIVVSTKGYAQTNKRDFGCDVQLDRCPWDGPEARAFRSFFRKREPVRGTESGRGNEEHRVESLLLSEFSAPKDKALPNIKPVMLGGIFFPMPTPLSASSHGHIAYSKQHGGGIDILARTGTGGRNTHLCIIELKDQNLPSEPAKDAVEQALAYTVFIRELLRSPAGAGWWKLFGMNEEIPEKLALYAACAMPLNNTPDRSFDGARYQIEQDEINLNYIYFTEEANQITDIITSLSHGKQMELER